MLCDRVSQADLMKHCQSSPDNVVIFFLIAGVIVLTLAKEVNSSSKNMVRECPTRIQYNGRGQISVIGLCTYHCFRIEMG